MMKMSAARQATPPLRSGLGLECRDARIRAPTVREGLLRSHVYFRGRLCLVHPSDARTSGTEPFSRIATRVRKAVRWWYGAARPTELRSDAQGGALCHWG